MTKKNNDIWEIYVIQNTENNKPYVGQTCWGTNHRFKYHIKNTTGRCIKLFNALNHYGREKFYVTALISCKTQEDADFWEILFIKQYDSIKNGYNIREGGSRGKLSEDTKQKLSEAKKKLPSTFLGKRHTEEAKRLIGELAAIRYAGSGNPMFGKKHSVETKALIGADSAIRNAGEGNPMFGKTGELSPLFGRNHSEATKRKMSKAGKGRIMSDEAKEKIRQSHLGKKLSIESIEKREATRKINNAKKLLAIQMQTFYNSTIYANLDLTATEIENIDIKEFKYTI